MQTPKKSVSANLNKVEAILDINLIENNGKIVVKQEKKLMCPFLNEDKSYLFKAGDSILLVILFSMNINDLKAIHEALPSQNLFTQEIFDGFCLLTQSRQKEILTYMLCIDNSEIASYFRQFGLGDMLEQDWVKACIKASLDESKKTFREDDYSSFPKSPEKIKAYADKSPEYKRQCRIIEVHEEVKHNTYKNSSLFYGLAGVGIFAAAGVYAYVLMDQKNSLSQDMPIEDKSDFNAWLPFPVT